jgi:hypothetical protein
MRFKWGALLAVAALGCLGAAVFCCCLPWVSGAALDCNSGRKVLFHSVLNMHRYRVHSEPTMATFVILDGQARGREGKLLAYEAEWHLGLIPGYLSKTFGIHLALPLPPLHLDTDRLSLDRLDSVRRYIDSPHQPQRDGITYGFTPAGKAQLLYNMLEVMRRRGESKYVNPNILPELLRGLGHPAGPDDVPTSEQIISIGSKRS